MKAIYKKEIASYFHSLIGCLFIAIFLFFIGMYYSVYNLSYGSPYVSLALSGVAMIYIFLIPLLTMKSMAEEKKQKTDQLLLTAPVKASEILLGKYFAMLTVLAVPIVTAAFYPLLLLLGGSVPFAETYIAFLGFFLFGAACAAIGIFLSSLTENQIVAAVLTFAALLLGFMITGINAMISPLGNWFTAVLNVWNTAERLDAFLNGMMNMPAMLYFLSVIFIFLMLAYFSLQKKRRKSGMRGLPTFLSRNGLAFALIAAIIGGNIAFSYLPAAMTSYDVTDDKVYSIGSTTKELLRNLQEEVTVYVLNAEETADVTIKTMLTRYTSESPKVKVIYKSPELFPNFAEGYGAENLAYNSMIIESNDRFTTVAYDDCFIWENNDYYSYYTDNSADIIGYDGEGQITSAISFVTSEQLPKLYIIGGHEEIKLPDSVLRSITKLNIDVEQVELLRLEEIPQDAIGLVIAGPLDDYSPDDVEKVNRYLAGGGNAVILTAASTNEMPDFESMLEAYGIRIAAGIVFEGNSSAYYQHPFYLLPFIEYHPVTERLYTTGKSILMYQAKGFMIDEEALPAGVYQEVLLWSTDDSYSKVNIETMKSYEQEMGDISGPFALGVYIEKEWDDAVSRIVAFSSEYLLDEELDSLVAGANSDLFMDALQAAVNIESDIFVPVKNYQAEAILFSKGVSGAVGFCVTAVLPFTVLAGGIFVWIKRRKSYGEMGIKSNKTAKYK